MQRERDRAIASDRYDVAVAAQVRSKMPRNLQGAAVAMFVFLRVASARVLLTCIFVLAFGIFAVDG